MIFFLGLSLGIIASAKSILAPTIPTCSGETLIILQENSLLAPRNHLYGIRRHILGVLMDKVEEDALNGVSASAGENTDWDLFYKILECESNFKNICNQDGCKYGQGIAQIIPGTVKYCEEKLGKKIDPFNESENLECAIWLFVNEGWKHWGFPPNDPRGYINGVRWGSYDCFKDFIN